MVGSTLEGTLAEVRRKIGNAGARGLNEQNTKASLIEPVLRALGWNTEDSDEVEHEYCIKPVRAHVDYGLRVGPAPRLFVEAKPLGTSLDDPRCLRQILGYASAAGVQWIVLTNGDEYRIYNGRATGGVDEKFFRKVGVKDATPLLAETLELFSKAKIEKNLIQELWLEEFTDRAVKTALDAMLTGGGDAFLVKRVSERSGLERAQVKRSLQRCTARFAFPPSTAKSVGKPPQGRAHGSPNPGVGPKSKPADAIKLLLTAGVLRPPVQLARSYKGKDLTARIEADGTVTCAGQSHASLNRAAQAAMVSVGGHGPGGKKPAVDAWRFWEYQSAGGVRSKLAAAWQSFVSKRPGAPAAP